ncbi:MAG: carboxypeptidase regulatory-like domain-containing protein [Planctomycetes bacterium]|nr:carboxypeptidase regulatory-like domain-containing protein [Planctomycetota bacterium]
MQRTAFALAVATLLVAAIVVLLIGRGAQVSPGEMAAAAPAPQHEPEPATTSDTSTADAPTTRLAVATDASAADTAMPSTLTVVVLTAEERPVAGAEVTVIDRRQLGSAFAAADTAMHMPDGRRIRAEIAERATTDARGEAAFAIAVAPLMIEATCDDQWGVATVPRLPQDRRVTVTIGPDRDLQVQVVTAEGAPRADVPVLVRRQRTPPPRPTFSSQVTMTEGAAGIATFEHFQRRLQQGTGWHVTFAFPLRDEPAVPVSAATPLSPPQRLVLPPTGGLSISVRDVDGKVPPLDDVEVGVEAATNGAPMSKGPWSSPALNRELGTAMVPWLGLGLDLTVTLRHRRSVLISTELSGPRSPGEIVDCALRLSPDQLVQRQVRGRFVRRDGTPWPACTAEARPLLQPRPSDWPRPQQVQIDDAGRFELTVEHACPPGGSRSYQWKALHPDGSGHVRVSLALDQRIPPTGLDLGDVVLDHGELLVAGTVLGPDDRPIAGARIRVRHRTLVGDREFWPDATTSGTERTGEDGRFFAFVAHGEADPGSSLRIQASCDGFVATADQEVVRGATNVILVLSRAGAVAGSIALGEGQTAADFVLLIRGEVPPAGATQPMSRASSIRHDGTFEVSELAPGSYTLSVRRSGAAARWQRPPPAEVGGLQIVAGETCRDPRIQRIEIAGPERALQITIVDRLSTPLQHASVTVIGAEGAHPVAADSSGICRLPYDTLPVDLEVTAFGHRPRLLRGVTGDQQVALERGITVLLRCGARPTGRDPQYQLAVYLYHTAPGRTRQHTYGATWPWGSRNFDGNGELLVRLPGPGDYECEPFVFTSAGNVGRGAEVEMPQPRRITVLEGTEVQTFELDIPQHLVDAAVARANR